ncbi:MAG TPA: helix-turn-helix domain-containing protein [Pseudonocardiaceae bacterium]|jgi:AcrR family transcriptional regulator|nr:helix-turn-helix domain-containing protein [Pseudonocardiaceae bacterium]
MLGNTGDRQSTRQRAPAMTVELRRAAIIEAALPLLVEHGPTVTTSQIATAAGIAEGTVFRAFRDKRELLLACLRAAVESDAEALRIEAIDRTLPLAERLAAAISYATDYQTRLWAVGQAVHSAGVEVRREEMMEKSGPPKGIPHAMLRVSAAIGALFEPEREQLRIEPERAAQMLLGLVLASRLQQAGFGPGIGEPAQIVDLFLHGTLRATKEKP